MRVRSAYSVVLLLLLLLIQGTDVSAQTPGEEIDVHADNMSVEGGGKVIRAEGNVEIKRQETVLKAQSVRVNREDQKVEARGQVSVTSPEWQVEADSMQMNLQDETGEILGGEVFIDRGHISLTGERFEKFTGQSFEVDNGSFTTCLCESGTPTWKITAKEIGLDKEGRGYVRGGTFRVKDVPILYLPYAVFPMRTERQTGFLFPKLGSSNKEGFRYQQPFFWAISKSMDATLESDIETRARLGAIGEFRDVFSRSANLRLSSSYFNEFLRHDADSSIEDQNIADPHIPKNRWSAIGTHRALFGSAWQTYSDIFAFSDDLFTRELVDRFDLSPDQERSVQAARFAPSRLGVFRSTGNMHFRGEWDAYQDFIQDDDQTFFGVPKFYFWGQHNFGLPLELNWRAEGVNYVRQKGADGLRLDLRPEITLPFRIFPYLSGSLGAAPRETVYHLYSTEGIYTRNKSRELVELTGNLGTSVSNVFSWNGSALKKIKHVLEPRVSYLFIPGVNQSDIPIMDGIDRINRRNLVTFSLVNRFLGKFAREVGEETSDRDVELLSPELQGDIREMGRLGMTLSYDIDKERRGGDTLSDLDVNLTVKPRDYLSWTAYSGLDPGPWQFTQAGTEISLTDPRPIPDQVLDKDFMRPNTFRLSYRYIRQGPLAPLAENANLTVLPPPSTITEKVLGQLGVHSLLHVTHNILLLYDGSYSTRDNRFSGNRGGIKLLSPCECWTVSFSVNKTTNPSKTSFNFGFSLLGLGASF